MGFFTVLKAYKCKKYDPHCEMPDGSNWFNEAMIVIKTDDGFKYKVPFIPWIKGVVEDKTNKRWHEFFDEEPWY